MTNPTWVLGTGCSPTSSAYRDSRVSPPSLAQCPTAESLGQRSTLWEQQEWNLRTSAALREGRQEFSFLSCFLLHTKGEFLQWEKELFLVELPCRASAQRRGLGDIRCGPTCRLALESSDRSGKIWEKTGDPEPHLICLLSLTGPGGGSGQMMHSKPLKSGVTLTYSVYAPCSLGKERCFCARLKRAQNIWHIFGPTGGLIYNKI